MNNFQPIKAVVNEYDQRDGIIHIPKDSPLPSSGKWPLIYFQCGRVKPTVNDLISEALPKWIEANGSPSGIDPRSGKKVKFGLIALVDQWWSPDIKYVRPALKAAATMFAFDPQCLFTTGLSAGGGQVNAIILDPDLSTLFAAAAPMSVSGVDQNLADWKPVLANRLETWYIAGSYDSQYKGMTQQSSQLANQIYPGSSRYTELPGGHDDGVWGAAYDPNFKIDGKESLYDWFLSEGLGLTPGVIPVIPPDPVNPPPPAKTVKSVVISYSDGSADTLIK
jgi:hypothetical protein